MRTAVLLSPHLDDVAFSCGGTAIALSEAGWRTVVVTAFTSSVPNPMGFALACQLDKGLAHDVDYLALRRAEDEEFARRAGIDRLSWLDLAEAPHRGYGSADALFGEFAAADDVAIVLERRLARCLDAESPDLVLAPQALGAHVDHRRVADAVVAVVPMSVPVWWYRDVPYAIRFPQACSPQPTVEDLPEDLVDITGYGERKGHAAVAYRTQLGFQFGGPEACDMALRRFARSEAARLDAKGGAEAFRVRARPGGCRHWHPGTCSGQLDHTPASEEPMNIDKSQILDLLRSRGDQDQADQADRELPDQVDTDRDQGLLSKFGLDIGDLLKQFGGGGGLGKILGG